jgi:predicted PurR-regulated permease PerM
MSDRRTVAITFTLALAVGMLLVALVSASPDVIARRTLEMYTNALVGISVGIAENPYNQIAQQIADREGELTERETSLVASEQALQRRENSIEWKATLAVYSMALSIILFILVGFNFYRDWQRSRVVQTSGPGYAIRIGKK